MEIGDKLYCIKTCLMKNGHHIGLAAVTMGKTYQVIDIRTHVRSGKKNKKNKKSVVIMDNFDHEHYFDFKNCKYLVNIKEARKRKIDKINKHDNNYNRGKG